MGPTAQAAFPGFAYTAFVDPDGTLSFAWDVEVETWSQGIGSPATDPNGEGINNAYGLAVCFSGQDPTDAQWATLQRLLDALASADGLGRLLVFTGHGLVDPGTTECPGAVATARLQPV